jgi:hypothetical protein
MSVFAWKCLRVLGRVLSIWPTAHHATTEPMLLTVAVSSAVAVSVCARECVQLKGGYSRFGVSRAACWDLLCKATLREAEGRQQARRGLEAARAWEQTQAGVVSKTAAAG